LEIVDLKKIKYSIFSDRLILIRQHWSVWLKGCTIRWLQMIDHLQPLPTQYAKTQKLKKKTKKK